MTSCASGGKGSSLCSQLLCGRFYSKKQLDKGMLPMHGVFIQGVTNFLPTLMINSQDSATVRLFQGSREWFQSSAHSLSLCCV